MDLTKTNIFSGPANVFVLTSKDCLQCKISLNNFNEFNNLLLK